MFPEPLGELFAYFLVRIHEQDGEVFAHAEFEVDCPGGTCLGAGRTAQTVVQVHHIVVGNMLGHRQMDGCALCQSGIEFAGYADRADLGALAAARAFVGIHKGRAFAQGGLELARISVQGFQFGGKKQVDVAVKQSLAQAELAGSVPFGQGQHFAHAAVVAGKLMVQLGQKAPDMRLFVYQHHLMAGPRPGPARRVCRPLPLRPPGLRNCFSWRPPF